MTSNNNLSGLAAVTAAITMLFAALSSAYIVRRGLSNDWIPYALPRVIWISPLALAFARGRAAVPLGVVAFASMVESWRELAGANANPGVTFALIFLAAFLVFLLSGIVALLRNPGSGAVRFYWLYLTGLLCWLLLLLGVWQ